MTMTLDNIGAEIPDNGFAALGLHSALVSALVTLGYEEPTPIQREAIPAMIAGRDLLGQAATGTGKTAAFALPMLHRIAILKDEGGERRESPIRGLVLVPTRELAMQVAEAIHKYGKGLGISVLPVYGGTAIQTQLRALRRGIDVVVATPGRALDLLRRGSMSLASVAFVVLDEADEMLDMGFADDLEALLESLPATRQAALFSATMPPRIAAIGERHLSDPERISIAKERTVAGEMPRVRQVAYIVSRQHKVAALGRVLDMENPTSAIVFCRTRNEVDVLTETLSSRGFSAEAIHGGLNQEQRDRVMRKFRDGTVELLVATDVAARGLDIKHLSHVVNFDVPSAPEAYVHRIGRTGRAGGEGVAITFAEPREHRQLRAIEYTTRQKILVEQVPTAVDLRARRLELTRAALREVLVAGDLDSFRVVVETLCEDFDVMDVATAAVKMAHEASAGPAEKDDEEIPAARVSTSVDRDRDRQSGRRERLEGSGRTGRVSSAREGRGGSSGAGGSGGAGSERGWARWERGAEEGGGASVGGVRPERSERGTREPRVRGSEKPARTGRDLGETARLFIGVGRRAGVRPADLVGAIANEAGLDSREIGSIDIADRFSLVDVREDAADQVIQALRGATIRGQKVTVRRDKDGE